MGFISGLLGNASETSIEKVAEEFAPVLVSGERVERAYKVIRDLFVFTDKRLIIVDKQGMTGRKIDFQSIPYRSIVRFSKESAGIMDLDAELKIWLSGLHDPICKEFGKDDHVNDIYQLLGEYILNR
jgi:hypothetical protein